MLTRSLKVFNTGWTGLPPVSVSGTDDVPGATRTFNITANGTSYELTELLIQWSAKPDGSFQQRYRQNPKTPVVTIPAAQGGYSYHGYWATLKGQQTLVPNETSILYNVYRCDIGVPFNTAPAHESSIANISSILSKEGELTGVSITPFSTLSLVAG
ncbi:hypothetical protein IMSHALPRED_005483 [Imshaugia aleurites]|uniref:Uncharacterized protein n=1 Tax=Imshaugia aleurites TaxID=172621 RepID=A0A8H3I4Q1_9LECA|nr:hypothetical protein IMSHALPRED_005483 [Imshaugia aleurites]